MHVASARWRGLYYGWVVVGAAFTVLFASYGVQYSFGVFLPSIEEDIAPGHRAAISLGFSVYSALYSLFSLLSGRLTDLWGPRRVVMMGGALLGTGILLTSRASHLWHFYLSYGLLAALGMSTAFVPNTSTVAKWFVSHRGLAVGLTAAGSGLGQLTVPLLSAALLGALGWRSTYLIYGLGLIACFTLAGLLLEKSPEAKGLLPYVSPKAAPMVSEGDGGEDCSFRLSEAVRTQAFWLFTAFLFVFWSMVFLPVVHLPSFAKTSLKASTGQAAFTISAIAMGSTFGRLMGGAISDVIGRRPTLVLATLLQMVSFLGMLTASLLKSLALTYPSAVLFGMGYGSTGPVYAAYAGDMFGRRYLSSIAGTIFSLAAGATSIGIYTAAVIYEAMGSYSGAFALGMGVTALALPLILMVRPPRRAAVT
jgi:MFS family permease